MPKDGWGGKGGKSQLFRLNYVYGVFSYKTHTKKNSISKKNDFYLSF